MDLRFGLLVILLIFDATFVWSSDDKHTGNHGSAKKKKKDSIKLSEGIGNNPFLQSITLPTVPSNPFLQSIALPTAPSNPFVLNFHNNSGSQSDMMPNIFLPQFYGNRSESQSFGSLSNIFLPQENSHTALNIFANSNNPFLNSIGTGPKIDTPVTQAPYAPASSYNMPAPNTPVPFTTNESTPVKVGSSVSSPSLIDLIGSTRPRSESKCNEYVREIVGTTDITSLTGTSSNVIKVNNICRNANQLVVGGTEANTGEFPHMVALGRRNTDETFILMCGGTLISHSWVLSAAHCTYGPNGGPTDARIGSLRLTGDEPGITVAIDNAIRHPSYKPPALYDDIALVKLATSVTFSTLIRPACLYQQYDSVPTQAWVTGWGSTEFGGNQNDQLLKAQLTIVNNLACTIWHNTSSEAPHGITPRMICAGDPQGGWIKDSCQGDSGGPLQVIHPRNQCLFQVIGITSFGRGCANVNSPGIYTRVSHYLPWIENIVWPQEQ
ncbi:hypothetical protein DMN91_005750 [Ooceraea biroi]|uniref:chymotrypsin n=1 Tax=Ooceraea biroi TaxID=2015173 RepID=A0A026X2H6_OOCBI|nr:serine protease snake [Ooceraea biroi]EZA62510.1 Serine protease snake [Ooceraea biroi]RLU21377.1 hypothetical protein DMN91_005750 [Ooceraea biroi]